MVVAYRHVCEFFRWWWQQLCDAFPFRLRGDRSAPDGLVIALEAVVGDIPAARISQRRRGQEREIGHYILDEAGTYSASRAISATASRGARTMIVLPPSALLEREVVLPLAAERDPVRVLQYEMSRLTPFSPDDVFWGWIVDHRDLALKRLHLQLCLVPKSALRLVFSALEKMGARPAMIEGQTQLGQTRRIRLSLEPSNRDRWKQVMLIAGIAICALLAIIVIVQPFIQQSLQLAAIESRIAALQPEADQAQAARRRIAAIAANGDVLAAERARLGNAVQAIAVATELLPDDTYLTDFTLRERKLTLTGQSAAVAKLIPLLSNAAAIRNPAFAAPVTRAENGRADLFSIRAEFAQ